MINGFPRNILLILVFSTTLFSSTYFDDGVRYFKSGDFKKAYTIFSKLSEDGTEKKDLDFYLGRSAFEVGNFDEALFAFDRVLIEIDETDKNRLNRAKLELARTHLALGENETAKKLFQEVLDSNPPEIVKDRILSILNSKKSEKKKDKKWNFFVNIETGYETNINGQPSIENMADYINNPEITPDEAVGSVYFQEMANIGYSHKFENEMFSIGANIFGYNQNYLEDSDFDISYFSAGITPNYRTKSYKVVLPLKAEYVEYGGEELLTAYSVELKSSKFISNQYVRDIIFDIYANYKIKDYTYVNNKQDSSIFRYGLAVTTKYKQHRFNARYSTEYEESENNISSVNANLTDKIINSIYLKYDYSNFLQLLDLSLIYSFRNIVYENYEAFTILNPATSDGCRKDRYNSVKVSFSKDIFIKNLNANISANYITNSSNHIPAEYENMITSFGVSYIF